MKLRILGSGTAVPALQRVSSSYLVTVPGETILVDIGPSVVRRLLEQDVSVNDIDVIVITHFHVDHTADLSTFLFAANYGTDRRKPLLILGGPGMHTFYGRLKSLYPWVAPKAYELTITTPAAGEYESKNGVCFQTRRMNHNRESIGVRITREKSVVFSGDTDYCKNLISLAQGADLLVAECAFPETKLQGHMNIAAVERIVREAKPKRVILSHLYPEWDEYQGVLHAPLLLAEDGLEIEL